MLHKIWKSKEIHKVTKLRVYEVLVLSVILYNTETWTLKESSKRRLRVFEMACLRTIEGVQDGTRSGTQRFGAGSDAPTT